MLLFEQDLARRYATKYFDLTLRLGELYVPLTFSKHLADAGYDRVTVLLIEDEFGCSGPDAVTIMYDSADAGELLQPLDNHPELMNI